jgi:hypothetical protein
MEKYTKKATARILKEVLKFKPDASGFTTLDQAFVILMDEWDLDISVEGHKDSTLVVLYKDGEKPKEWKFKNLWIPNEGDFDWNVIYKTVLEDIIYDKLYKRPKLGKRAQAKLEKEKAERKKQAKVEVEETEVVTVVIPKKEAPVDLEGLRDKRDALTMKIWYMKKEGKDTKELEYEKEEMNLMIRKLAKELKAKKA